MLHSVTQGKIRLQDCLLLFHVKCEKGAGGGGYSQKALRGNLVVMTKKLKNLIIRGANVESPLLRCAPQNQQHPHWVSLSADGSPAPWPPASPHPLWTGGPELDWDPQHSLAGAEQSRVVISPDLLYYFPTSRLAPSLFHSVEGDVFSLTRENSSSPGTWCWSPWRRLHSSGGRDWKQIFIGLSQSYCRVGSRLYYLE